MIFSAGKFNVKKQFGLFYTAFRKKHIVILLACLLLMVVMSLLFIFFNQAIYKDVANCYAWNAREYSRGFWNHDLMQRLPVLNIFIAGLLGRCGIESYKALIVVSSFFWIITVFPLYYLMKNFLSAEKSAWGCLLFATTPKIIRFAGSGLLESARDFFVVSAFALLMFSPTKKIHSWGRLILLGIVIGLLCLARGEGGILSLLVIVVLILLNIHRAHGNHKKAFVDSLSSIFIISVVATVTMFPRLYYQQKYTGYPLPDNRAIPVLEAIPVLNRIYPRPHSDFPQYPANIPQTNIQQEKSTGEKDFFINEEITFVKNLKSFPNSFCRGAYELYLIFAVLGIYYLLKQKKWKIEFTCISLFVVLGSLFYVFWVISYRYFTFVNPMLLCFTVCGIHYIYLLFSKKYCQRIITGVGVLILSFQIIDPVKYLCRKTDATRYEIGCYLKNNASSLKDPHSPFLRVYAPYDVEITYFADQGRCFDYNSPRPGIRNFRNFDIMILPRKKGKEAIDIVRTRNDVDEIKLSFEDYLFFKLRTTSNEK